MSTKQLGCGTCYDNNGEFIMPPKNLKNFGPVDKKSLKEMIKNGVQTVEVPVITEEKIKGRGENR